MKLFQKQYLAGGAALALTFAGQAQLSNYSQDFEGLDAADSSALLNDGWLLFASGINGVPGFDNFGAGPFGAPNNPNPQVSAITTTAGGSPPAGDQGLVVFSDYNSGLHQDPNDPRDLIISVFQEQTIAAEDIGQIVTFSFLADANANPPTGDAITEAFLITLDPNAGFSTTNSVTFDTTSLADGSPTAGQLQLDLSDGALVGQLLQFGFRNTSSDFEGSAVDYDNVNFVVPEPASLALIGFGSMALMRRRAAR